MELFLSFANQNMHFYTIQNNEIFSLYNLMAKGEHSSKFTELSLKQKD